MKIAIASDKAGFLLKEAIVGYLGENGYTYEDYGTKDIEKPFTYFEIASKVAPLVADKAYDRAILICGTGMGVSIVSNKFKDVYASCCESVYSAKMCRIINDANILCLGGYIIGPEMGLQMVDAFLNAEFTQGLEKWRQDFLTNASQKVREIENEIYKV